METCYISLEAAFQAIENIDENAGARGSGFTDPERIMRDSAFYALEAIQPSDVVPAPRWITVKERLPELYQNVLVHYKTLHCVEPHNYAVAFRQNGPDESFPGKHIWHVDSSPLELDGSDVTHWMPLPQPPKEGGTDNGN